MNRTPAHQFQRSSRPPADLDAWYPPPDGGGDGIRRTDGPMVGRYRFDAYDCISTRFLWLPKWKVYRKLEWQQSKISASAANQMQSPSRLHDSDVEGSTKSQNVSPADEASASGTPTKKAVTFQDPAIKKAVTKRGTRNQSFRNSRVSVAALGFVSYCAWNFERADEFLISFATNWLVIIWTALGYSTLHRKS